MNVKQKMITVDPSVSFTGAKPASPVSHMNFISNVTILKRGEDHGWVVATTTEFGSLTAAKNLIKQITGQGWEEDTD